MCLASLYDFLPGSNYKNCVESSYRYWRANHKWKYSSKGSSTSFTQLSIDILIKIELGAYNWQQGNQNKK